MDHKLLRKEILTALRGSRSQMQLSLRMRYGFNQVYRWESGTTRFLWSDFVRVCRTLKIDLAEPLQRVLLYLDKPEDGAALVRHLVSGTNLGVTAKGIAVSRFKLRRWASGESEVPFDQILALLQTTDSLLGFLQEIVPLAKLPSVAGQAQLRQEIAQALLQYPFLGGVMILLETEAYTQLQSHKEGWMAARMGISLVEERESLARAEDLGLIRSSGGKYVRAQAILSSRNFPEIEQAMRAYWIQRGIAFDRMRANLPAVERGYFGFLITSLTAEQEAQMRDAIVELGNRITAIALQPSKGTAKMHILNLQMFSPTSGRK